MILPSGWIETVVTDDGHKVRAYRKREGSVLVLTLHADTADANGADLAHEWADYLRRVDGLQNGGASHGRHNPRGTTDDQVHR